MNELQVNDRALRGAQLAAALGQLGYQVTEVLRSRFGANKIEVTFDASTITRSASDRDACRIQGTAAVDGTYWALYIEGGEIHLPGRDELEVITRPSPIGARAFHGAAA